MSPMCSALTRADGIGACICSSMIIEAAFPQWRSSMTLRLDRIELFHMSMTLTQPFETSFGVEHERPCIVVRLEGGGAVGWGECVAGSGPWYSYETVRTAWHVLAEFLVPLVL